MSALFHSIVNLCRQRGFNVELPEQTVAPTPPPPPTELSCFVKGLIHSMKTEPEKWDFYKPLWSHKELSVRWSTWRKVMLIDWCDLNLTTEESLAIELAVEQYLEAFRQRQIAEYSVRYAREKAEKIANTKALFEKLGCPDKTP